MKKNKIPKPESTIIVQGISTDELVNEVCSRLKPLLASNVSTPIPDDILTCKQVEELLDISHQTRINWTNKGFLQSYSLGSRRKIFYKRSEIINSLIRLERR